MANSTLQQTIQSNGSFSTPQKSTLKKLAGFSSQEFVLVDSIEDLPKAENGVITLEDNRTYFITGTVDLAGSRLVTGQNTAIIGGSSENCRIKSTGLSGTALITSEWSLPLRNVTIEASTALDLDASANSNQALDWFGVNFTDCATIGTIKSYNNIIWTDCGLLNSSGLTFDGITGTIGFSQCLFDGASGSTIITLPASLTITRRFRIIYSAFVVLSGETGINCSTSATIPVDSYILDTVNFSGGGTYTSGVLYSDNKALWISNKGVENSSEISYYTMNGNATETTISVQGTEYKAAGTTTSQSVTQKFTNTDNRATYTGAITRLFKVNATLSLTSGNNHQVGVYIAKNGSIITNTETYVTTSGAGRAENVFCQGLVSLATNDYIEIFVENNTATTNITVTDLSVIINAQN